MGEVQEFCTAHGVCVEGRQFAERYSTLAEVWDSCPRAARLFQTDLLRSMVANPFKEQVQ